MAESSDVVQCQCGFLAVRVSNLEDAICLRIIYLIFVHFFSACKNTVQARKYREFCFLVGTASWDYKFGSFDLEIFLSIIRCPALIPLDLDVHKEKGLLTLT